MELPMPAPSHEPSQARPSEPPPPPPSGAAARRFEQPRLSRLADRWSHLVFLTCSVVVVLLIVGILYFLASRGLAAFLPMAGNTGRTLSLSEVFLRADWAPSSDKFGIQPFLVGSLLVTGFALLIAAPSGILAGVFMARMAPPGMRAFMRQVMDLLVGIPSVVYGIFGLTFILPTVSRTWLHDAPAAGFGAAALILSVMIVPTIVSLSTDAFDALHPSLDEGARALGATRWQSIWRVLIPAARPRLLTAVVLGLGRAMGEAMAVQMVVGNNPQWISLLRESTGQPSLLRFLFMPAATLTTELVQELPNTPAGSTWNNVLFALGLLLYLITMALILATRKLGKGQEV